MDIEIYKANVDIQFHLERAIIFCDSDDEFKKFPGDKIREVFETFKDKVGVMQISSSPVRTDIPRNSKVHGILSNLNEIIEICQKIEEYKDFPGKDVNQIEREFSPWAMSRDLLS